MEKAGSETYILAEGDEQVAIPELAPPRVSLRPLRFLTALRVAIAALLTAFAVVLFLSFGKREEEAVRIHVSPPDSAPTDKVVDLSDNFAITGTKGGRESFRLLADQVTGFVGDKKSLRGVRLELFGEEGQHLGLHGTEGQFDMAEKKAHLSGEVRVEGPHGFSLTTSSLYFDGERDMIFTSDEISFQEQGLSGVGRGLSYLTRDEILKIPAEVRLTLSGEGQEPIVVTSADMSLDLQKNEIVFNQSVQLVRNGESFSGNFLQVNLDSSHRKAISAKAYGQVEASFLPGPNASPARLYSDSLTAEFGPDGKTLSRVEAQGQCRLESEGTTATSESITGVFADDQLLLRGEPVVTDSHSRISAREIDLHPGRRGLEARGDVKTTTQPNEGGGATPSYFSGKQPVFFQAARLEVEDGGGVARYSGSARGWQGEDSLQAEDIVLRFSDRALRAYRNVLCRFVGAETPPRSGEASPTMIVASALDYAEGEGTLHFREAVKMTRQDSTVLADRLNADLSDPASGKRRIIRMTAEGNVRFDHLTNTGTASRLVYLPDEDRAQMQQDAGLAEVVDRSNGRTLRGKTLTFDLKGNRVLTEGDEGGRTWITLSPKDKETRALDPKTGR